MLRRVHLKMVNWIENTDLNINTWLINWGYMNGYLQDGQFHTTKYTIFYQLMVIMILSVNIIRFGIILSNPKGSEITFLHGDWGYFLGSRIIIDGLCFLVCIFLLMVIALFKFCTQNLRKMFYWLYIMEFDPENKCFFNLDLNEIDSKVLLKQTLIFINTLKFFNVVFLPLFAFANLISVYKYVNDYYFNHFIGIMIYIPALYYDACYVFGVPIILYLVS